MCLRAGCDVPHRVQAMHKVAVVGPQRGRQFAVAAAEVDDQAAPNAGSGRGFVQRLARRPRFRSAAGAIAPAVRMRPKIKLLADGIVLAIMVCSFVAIRPASSHGRIKKMAQRSSVPVAYYTPCAAQDGTFV